MNTIQNPKVLALAQTVFYSACALIIPQLIGALGAGGALSMILPAWVTNYGIAAGIIVALNYFDNKIQARTGNAFFGSIS